MRKKLIAVVLLAFIIILFSKKTLFKGKTKVSFTTVKRGSLVNKISASGVVKSEKEVNLKFQTSGRLAWVGVQEEDFVGKWQTIAQLDTRELQKKFEKALRDYSKERWDFEQEREEQGVTTNNLDKYTLTNEVKRILEKNQFDLEKAVLDVELADIALKYATLVTPISGVVTRVDTPVAGVNITPATAVFTVADPNKVIFEANVDEIDIGKIKEGQEVILSLDAYPEEEIKSRIIRVGFQSKTTKGGGTVFPVKIKLPENKNLKFKLGMNGDVEIIVEKKENILLVPASAIMKRGEKKLVWVVEKGKAKKRRVKVGMETDEKVEILEGLKEGERIIAKDISKVKEGQRVN